VRGPSPAGRAELRPRCADPHDRGPARRAPRWDAARDRVGRGPGGGARRAATAGPDRRPVHAAGGRRPAGSAAAAVAGRRGAMEHDHTLALRLALTQSQWWQLRGRLTSQAPLLAAAAEHAEAGSDEWCAARVFLGQVASQFAEPDAALEHYTAVRDALENTERLGEPVGLVLMSICLTG